LAAELQRRRISQSATRPRGAPPDLSRKIDHEREELKMQHKPVRLIKIGDRLDLEHDIFANTSEDVTPQFEVCEVTGIERESATCIRLDFSNFISVGFPPAHHVKIAE
jgi:hypothetical protein